VDGLRAGLLQLGLQRGRPLAGLVAGLGEPLELGFPLREARLELAGAP
jgi:hypothetical protein